MANRYASKRHAQNVILHTLQLPWISKGTIDATAAAADSALGTTERTFQFIKSLDNAVYWLVPYGINSLLARFLLSTNLADVDIDVWVGRIASDPRLDVDADVELQRLCTLDVVCGQQANVGATKLFADTINVSNDVSDHGVYVASPGDDHVAIMKVDLGGVNLIVFHGYGTFDEDCEVQVSGY